jgi:anti-sigma B factor antagonist
LKALGVCPEPRIRDEDVLRLKCLNCGMTTPYRGSAGDYCPRCLVREQKAVERIAFSDEPSSAAGRSRDRLSITTSAQGDRYTLALNGELDIVSAQMLDEIVAEACSVGAKEVILDLGGIEFMDSEGLNALLRGRLLCKRHQCDYSLTPAQRPVQHLFEVTGLDGSLPFRDADERSA